MSAPRCYEVKFRGRKVAATEAEDQEVELGDDVVDDGLAIAAKIREYVTGSCSIDPTVLPVEVFVDLRFGSGAVMWGTHLIGELRIKELVD